MEESKEKNIPEGFILVCHDSGQDLLELDDNGLLDLNFLRTYFPDAVGLRYDHNKSGFHHLVRVKENLLHIVHGTKIYQLVTKNKQDSSLEKKKTMKEKDLAFIDENRHQFQHMLNNIRKAQKGQKRAKVLKVDTTDNDVNKKPKVSDLNAITQKDESVSPVIIKKKERNVNRVFYVGWKHKFFGAKKYSKQCAMKSVNITINKQETFFNFKLKLVEGYMKVNAESKIILAKSNVQLADKDDFIYTNFTKENYVKCTFEEFHKFLKVSNRANIFLLSEDIKNKTSVLTAAQADNKNGKSSVSSKKDNINAINEVVVEKKQVFNDSVKENTKESFEKWNKTKVTVTPINEDCNIDNKKTTEEMPGDITLSKIKKLKEAGICLPIITNDSAVTIGKPIGKGGQGCVFKGTWRRTNVAIKEVDTEMGNAEKYVLREIYILQKVSHQNVVRIMAVQPTMTKYKIIMELCEGMSLHHIIHTPNIKKAYNLTPQLKHSILYQVCLAINYLHGPEINIIHRDIKPANVIVTKRYQVKICDFGFSRSEDFISSPMLHTLGVSMIGTTPYLAPEQVLKAVSASKHTDIWSLACLIWEVYEGKQLFKGAETL